MGGESTSLLIPCGSFAEGDSYLKISRDKEQQLGTRPCHASAFLWQLLRPISRRKSSQSRWQHAQTCISLRTEFYRRRMMRKSRVSKTYSIRFRAQVVVRWYYWVEPSRRMNWHNDSSGRALTS